MVFMRRQVGDINGIDIKLLVVSGSEMGSLNALKLHGELPYLQLNNNNNIIPPHFMSLLQ